MAETDGAPITLFVPLRVDVNRPVSDLDRFLALALPSFRAHLDPRLVHEVLVVVPPGDVRRARKALAAAPPFPIRVIDESVLRIDAASAGGWIKQQIIKLAAPQVVTTPWFVTIDADVVATRSVDAEFLLPGGRAIWEREPAGAHFEWWVNSARVLGVPLVLERDTLAFGVTPAVMSTEAVRSLVDAIETAHPGSTWSRTLAHNHAWGWTEYTLYWTHLLATGRASALYSDVGRVPYDLAESVWTAAEFQTLASDVLDRVFAPDADHAFAVFQSNLERPLEETVRMLRPRITGETGITSKELRRWARHTRAHARRTLRYRLTARARTLLGR